MSYLNVVEVISSCGKIVLALQVVKEHPSRT